MTLSKLIGQNKNMLEYLTALHGTQDMRIDQNTSMLESASESQKHLLYY